MSRNMDYAAQAAALMEHVGQVQGQAALNRGVLRGQQIRAVPDTMQAFLSTHDAEKDKARQEQLQNLELSNAQMQHDRSMRDFTDEQTIRDIFGETPAGPDGQPDFTTIGGKVSKINPEKGAAYLNIGAEAKANAAKQAMTNLETIGRTLRDATPDNWTKKLDNLHGAGIDTSGMPETFDKQFVQDVNERMLTANEWLDQHAPKSTAPAREPIQRLVDGKPADVIPGADGNWYLPGDLKTPIAPNRITLPPKDKTPREPMTRLVDGKRADVVFGDDGNWYRPGNLKTPIESSRVASLPDASGAQGVTQAQRDTAERWMQGELGKIEKDFTKQKQQFNDGLIDTEPKQADMDGDKLRVLNSYRAQINLPAFSALPADWTGGGGPAPKPAPAAAPQPTATPPAKATKASFKQEPIPGGKIRVIGPDNTPIVFPSQAAADAAIDAFLKQ